MHRKSKMLRCARDGPFALTLSVSKTLPDVATHFHIQQDFVENMCDAHVLAARNYKLGQLGRLRPPRSLIPCADGLDG